MTRAQQIADHEQRFQRQGLPLLIEGYSATGDVFNRAFPLLALIFVGEILGSFSLKWPLLAELSDDLEQTFAARAEYLALLAEPAA